MPLTSTGVYFIHWTSVGNILLCFYLNCHIWVNRTLSSWGSKLEHVKWRADSSVYCGSSLTISVSHQNVLFRHITSLPMSPFSGALQWLPTATGIHSKLCGCLFSPLCVITPFLPMLGSSEHLTQCTTQTGWVCFLYFPSSKESFQVWLQWTPSESRLVTFLPPPLSECRQPASLFSLSRAPSHLTLRPTACLHSCLFY